MTNEVALEQDGRVVGGPGSEGVTITKIQIGDGMKKGQLKIEIGGVATDYLINPRDASDGSEPLPEPISVSEGVDIEAADKMLFLAKLNETFNLSPPLEDTEDEIMRFAEDGENSVYQQIIGRKVFFKLAVKPPTNPKYPPTVFSNMWKVPVKENATTSSIKAALDKIKAKKEAALKAQEEADKKSAELFA